MNQTKLQENLSDWTTQLQKAVDFVAKYPKLNEFVTTVNVTTDTVRIYNQAEDASTLAELFGRDNWVAKRDRYSMPTSYDWRKTVDGVEIVIMRMHVEPEPIDERPVMPKEWPIQITESSTLS